MTRFAFVTWDGGGNLPPAVGIAQELAARGNSVRFLGYEVQRAAIVAQAPAGPESAGSSEYHGVAA